MAAHTRSHVDILGGFEPTIVIVFVDKGSLFRMRDRDFGWRWRRRLRFLRAGNESRENQASEHSRQKPI
jgi:hypothetical protein